MRRQEGHKRRDEKEVEVGVGSGPEREESNEWACKPGSVPRGLLPMRRSFI